MKIFFTFSILVTISFGLTAQRNSSYQRADEWKYGSGIVFNKSKNIEWQNAYDLKFVNIDVEVHDTCNAIKGNVRYTSKCLNNTMTEMSFQLVPELVIDSVLVNGINSVYTRTAEVTTVTLPAAISPDQDFTWQVYYHGTPLNPVEYRGLCHMIDDVYLKHTLYTLSEPFHLKEWLPCKELLTDKLDSAWTFITTDTGRMAGSNGLLTNIVQLGNGLQRFEWKTRYPMTFYLLSLNVADYIEYNLYAHPAGYPDSVLVQNFVLDTAVALQVNLNDYNKTPYLIELYSRLFGLYPYCAEKYGHCMVKLPGAMEHQTMTTSGTYWDWVIAHELAHQWFGDYVTCATWQDIWVNEGWATYAEYLFYEDTGDNFRMNAWTGQTFFQSKQQPLGSVYVPFSEINNEDRIFSWDLSYKKGGAILRMMRYLINNDSLFFEGVREFISQYADSNATGADFRDILESKTSVDLNPFFDEWYYGQGYPIFDITWYNQPGGANTFNVSITSEGSSPVTDFTSLPVQLKLHLDNGTDTIARITLTGTTGNYSVNTGTALCQTVEYDPGDFVCDSLRSLSQSVTPLDQEPPVIIYYSETNDVLKIIATQESMLPMDIYIVASDGKIVYNGKINSNRTEISMSGLAGSVYTARISGNSTNRNYKFVKTR